MLCKWLYFFKPIHFLGVEKLFIKIKQNCLFFKQGLPNYILIKSAIDVAVPLSIIFNKCFENGIFPSS